jgi:hypothetical protein
MATPERIESLQVEVEELVSTLECTLEEIQANSKMTPFDVETESSKNDPTSIYFVPENHAQRQAFSCLVTDELILRGLDINGTLEEWWEMLQEAMKGESTIARLSKEISHGEVKEGAYFLLMQTLPCMLHMENCNGIKILTMVLIEGLSNAKKKMLYQDINAEGVRVSHFISDIQSIINKSVIGTQDDPCQWMCPFDSKKRRLVLLQWTMCAHDALLILLNMF